MRLACKCLALVMLCGFTNVSGDSLLMYPTKAAIKPHGYVNITCKTNRTSLVECLFRLIYHPPGQVGTVDGPAFNFTSRHELAKTQVNEPGTKKKLYDIAPYSSGSTKNECGIQLSHLKEGRYLVGCRAKTAYGDWNENYMALYVDGKKISFDSDRADNDMIKVVKFGDSNTTLDLETDKSNYLTGPCILEGEHNVTLIAKPSLSKGNSNCRLSIAADNGAVGPLWAAAPYKKRLRKEQRKNINPGKTTRFDHNNILWHFIKIIVLEKPKSIALVLYLPLIENLPKEEKVLLEEGQTMTATCSVHDSRYGADIIWLFGNETLPHKNNDGWTVSTKNNTLDWTWPWEAKIIEQTVSRKLLATDNGKDLKCTARYFDSLGSVQETVESGIQLFIKSKHAAHQMRSNSGTPRFQFRGLFFASLSFNLVQAIAAGIIFARVAKKCCFRGTDSVQLRHLPFTNRNTESSRMSENPSYEAARQLMPKNQIFELPQYYDVKCPEPEPKYEEINPNFVRSTVAQ